MSDFTNPTYNEATNGDLPVASSTPPFTFGVDLQVLGTASGLNDVDQLVLDVRSAGETTYHPTAPDAGSSLHVTLSAPNASYFDFIIYDQALNILFRQLDNDPLTTATFSVDTVLNIPATSSLIFSMNGFNGLNFNPVNYTLNIDGTPTGGSPPPSTATPIASFAPGSFAVREGNTISVVVQLDHAVTSTVFVGYHVDDLGATRGSDYQLVNPLTPNSGVIQFAPGTTTQTIQIQTLSDTIDEPYERFQIVLEDSQTADLPGGVTSQPSNPITIVDDDGPWHPEDYASSLPTAPPPPGMDWGAPEGESISPRFGYNPSTGRWIIDILSNASEWAYDSLRDFAIGEVTGAFNEEARNYLDALGNRFGLTGLYAQVQQSQQLYNALTNLHTRVYASMMDGLEGNISFDELNTRIDSALAQFPAEVTGANDAVETAIDSVGSAVINFTLSNGTNNLNSNIAIVPTGEAVNFALFQPFSTFTGSTGRDVLAGGGQADLMLGDLGDDMLFGGRGNDYIYGGGGADKVAGGAGSDTLLGDAGNDMLYGGDGFDNLYGGADADTLYGGANEDIVVGDAGNDTLYGGDGGDVLSELFDPVNSGDDILDGGNGIDIMYSAAGNDTVYGGTDTANNYGNLGDGNDTYQGSAGTDVVQGGAGNDIISGNAGADSLYGEDGSDNIAGGDGIDLVSGGLGNDTLYGGSGNDLLVGDDGNDGLVAGDGIDVLYGGAGDDSLADDGNDGAVDAFYGGAGNDTFYVGRAGAGTDYIWDFHGGAGASDVLRYPGPLTPLGGATTIATQFASSGNYYVNFSNGTQVVLVGVTSLLSEDIIATNPGTGGGIVLF